MIQFAASTFEIIPEAGGDCAGGLREQSVFAVYGPLKSSILLIEENSKLIALHTSHFITDYYCVSILLRQAIAKAIGIPISQVFCFSSHNHCTTRLNAKTRQPFMPISPDSLDPLKELTKDGLKVLEQSVKEAALLKDKLQPAEVFYGTGKERRITHNRKGRRADGSTYFMREEDRLLLGSDFNGDIDDDAFVIGFFKENQALGFITQFTGHPVTAYHCDYPIVYGEFPQVACDDLSAEYGNVPVAFLQGCAGDVNSKGLLSGLPTEESLLRAERYGHLLGETFIEAAKHLRPSIRKDMTWSWKSVHLPYRQVPPASELKIRLQKVEDFIARCEAGDSQETQFCDGLNFPQNMKLKSRKHLMDPTRRWLKWALAFHAENRLQEAPAGLDISIATIRIGDVGIVGLPGEPLLGIGRRIKQLSSLPVTIPCGYMNEGQDTWAYLPDGANCEDMDYCSSFYRYTEAMLPFQKPAGDLLAIAAIQMLKKSLL